MWIMWGGKGEINRGSYDCCLMPGITCAKKDGNARITVIQWPFNGLKGNIGSSIAKFPDLEKL
jgi:hypothetical protein